MRSVAVALGLLLVGTGTAMADVKDDALSAMLRCSGMQDRDKRLACYDAAVVRAPGALTQPAPAAPVAGAVPPAAPAVAARRSAPGGFLGNLLTFNDGPDRAPHTSVAQFGSESIASGGREAHPNPMAGDTIDQISARLVSYQINNGFMIATLDNGQIWKQVAGSAMGTLARPALSYTVVIGRSTKGNYSMKLSNFGRALPVRRIR